jgi:hypothetical protein
MNTEPPKKDQANSAFQVNPQGQPPLQKRKNQQEEDESLIGDVVDEVTEGCLMRIITLPFRIILGIVRAIFD